MFNARTEFAFGLNYLALSKNQGEPFNVHADFKPFAVDNNGISVIQYARSNKQHGRIVLDCDYSKLSVENWKKAGVKNYVSNAIVWLTLFDE